MNQYDAYTDQPEEDDILHYLLLQRLIDHGIAAVFDDNHLAGIFPDVGKGGGQDFRTLHVGEFILHCSSPQLR